MLIDVSWVLASILRQTVEVNLLSDGALDQHSHKVDVADQEAVLERPEEVAVEERQGCHDDEVSHAREDKVLRTQVVGVLEASQAQFVFLQVRLIHVLHHHERDQCQKLRRAEVGEPESQR